MADREFWESQFAQEVYAYGTEPNTFVRQVAPQLPKGRTLAVADGGETPYTLPNRATM